LNKKLEDEKTFHVHGSAVLLKMTYSFNANFIKIPMIFFTELEKKIQKSNGNMKDSKQPL
jgi:hypothetical protein